jgi:hypothetical protein
LFDEAIPYIENVVNEIIRVNGSIGGRTKEQFYKDCFDLSYLAFVIHPVINTWILEIDSTIDVDNIQPVAWESYFKSLNGEKDPKYRREYERKCRALMRQTLNDTNEKIVALDEVKAYLMEKVNQTIQNRPINRFTKKELEKMNNLPAVEKIADYSNLQKVPFLSLKQKAKNINQYLSQNFTEKQPVKPIRSGEYKKYAKDMKPNKPEEGVFDSISHVPKINSGKEPKSIQQMTEMLKSEDKQFVMPKLKEKIINKPSQKVHSNPIEKPYQWPKVKLAPLDQTIKEKPKPKKKPEPSLFDISDDDM